MSSLIWKDLIDGLGLLQDTKIIKPENQGMTIYFKTDSSIDVGSAQRLETYGDFIVVVENRACNRYTSYYAWDDIRGIMFTEKV
jgi:hypothetical protein